jgi:predicted RNA binding protein YcfA (HicA-like mRNA interferase family)
MPKLPRISGQKLVKIFLRLGYEVDHQTGSHMILRHKNSPHRRLTIPNHPEILKGTLLSILKQAGLARDEFFDFA